MIPRSRLDYRQSEDVRIYEALQARYRESIGQPAGPPTNPASQLETVEHCLPKERDGFEASEHGLNIMSDAAREYTRERLAALKPISGVAFVDRLWRNLLSSQPLAFSIAGELRRNEDAAAALLSELTGYEVRALETLYSPDYPGHALYGVEAEWFPPKEAHTNDGSGFDIAALLRLVDGSRLLLTIEVKYVDSFSRAKLGAERYTRHLEAVGLDAEATNELASVGCSQFLRSVLLTDSVRRGGLTGIPGDEARIEHALAVVLAREDDQTARDVVDRLGAHQLPTATSLWTHREFFLAAKEQAELRQWAVQMLDRYVPASP